jgi:hypothetical protein
MRLAWELQLACSANRASLTPTMAHYLKNTTRTRTVPRALRDTTAPRRDRTHAPSVRRGKLLRIKRRCVGTARLGTLAWVLLRRGGSNGLRAWQIRKRRRCLSSLRKGLQVPGGFRPRRVLPRQLSERGRKARLRRLPRWDLPAKQLPRSLLVVSKWPFLPLWIFFALQVRERRSLLSRFVTNRADCRARVLLHDSGVCRRRRTRQGRHKTVLARKLLHWRGYEGVRKWLFPVFRAVVYL